MQNNSDRESGNIFLRDSRYATRFYGLNNQCFQSEPHYKWLFYIRFVLNNPDFGEYFKQSLGANDPQNGLSMRVKSVDRPSINYNLETKHQYNKKRVIQTGLDYQPISVRLRDTTDNLAMRLLADYYLYYYGDGRKENEKEWDYDVAKGTFLDKTGSKFPRGKGWGFAPPVKSANQTPFFSHIELYDVYHNIFNEVVIVNPLIESFTQDTDDYDATNDYREINISFRYEGIIYKHFGSNIDEHGKNSLFGKTKENGGFFEPEDYLSQTNSNNNQKGVQDAQDENLFNNVIDFGNQDPDILNNVLDLEEPGFLTRASNFVNDALSEANEFVNDALSEANEFADDALSAAGDALSEVGDFANKTAENVFGEGFIEDGSSFLNDTFGIGGVVGGQDPGFNFGDVAQTVAQGGINDIAQNIIRDGNANLGSVLNKAGDTALGGFGNYAFGDQNLPFTIGDDPKATLARGGRDLATSVLNSATSNSNGNNPNSSRNSRGTSSSDVNRTTAAISGKGASSSFTDSLSGLFTSTPEQSRIEPGTGNVSENQSSIGGFINDTVDNTLDVTSSAFGAINEALAPNTKQGKNVEPGTGNVPDTNDDDPISQLLGAESRGN